MASPYVVVAVGGPWGITPLGRLGNCPAPRKIPLPVLQPSDENFRSGSCGFADHARFTCVPSGPPKAPLVAKRLFRLTELGAAR